MRSERAGGERQKHSTAGPGRAEAQGGESSEESEEKEGSGHAAGRR